jgi:GTPase SAR1 family protein
MDRTFKCKSTPITVLVVGDIGVGKTTAVRRFIGRPFATKVVPTVGYEFYSKCI